MNILEFRTIISTECRLEPDRLVLLGVSGGPDSLCLLDLLCRLEIPTAVAHFDHGLRPDSARDAAFVRQEAEKRGLPFRTARQDVAELARVEHLSIEEAARKARYIFLFEMAAALNAQALAVAHTADDQVETVLMHFLRGSGLKGLKGMTFRAETTEWNSSIPLVRPLLKTWRAEVEEYCLQRSLQPILDPTNQETLYFRNRLRHQLIPALQEYNPKIKEIVWRTAQTLAGEQEVLNELLEPVWQRCLVRQGGGYVGLSYPALAVLLPGQQRAILRRAIKLLRPSLRDIDFNTVERARAFLAAPTRTFQLDLANGLRLLLENDLLFLAEWNALILDREWPQAGGSQPLELPLPGELLLDESWKFSLSLQEGPFPPARLNSGDPFQAWLDLDTLSLPLQVRSRQPGDRFQPLGLDGHTLKLSDFFINEHLHPRAREGWPLVCSAKQIAWIPGYRPAHFCRVTSETKKAIFIELTNFKPGA